MESGAKCGKRLTLRRKILLICWTEAEACLITASGLWDKSLKAFKESCAENVMCVSLSPGRQERRGITVYSGGNEWVINRENTHCGMQGRLCVRLGVSLPFLQKSKAAHNKVCEVACGQGCCEIRSLYLCQMPTQKTPSTDHGTRSTPWHQMCVTEPWRSGMPGCS